MSKFYIPSTSQSATSTPAYSDNGSDEEEDNLPYPAELSRKDFLAPDFDPQNYLSTLRNRHQTLEDLRSDLRQRSHLLNKELLDLVNGNYEEFLSLGGDLMGGEERVEGVRVGLLGFQREVEGIQKAVHRRAAETEALLHEKKALRKDIMLARKLMDLHESVEELESSLGIHAEDDEGDDYDSDEVESDEAGSSDPLAASVRRVARRVQQYVLIVHQAEHIGLSHPFVQEQQPRLNILRSTILLDLATVVKSTRSLQAPDTTLSVLRLYSDMGAEKEALRVLNAG